MRETLRANTLSPACERSTERGPPRLKPVLLRDQGHTEDKGLQRSLALAVEPRDQRHSWWQPEATVQRGSPWTPTSSTLHHTRRDAVTHRAESRELSRRSIFGAPQGELQSVPFLARGLGGDPNPDVHATPAEPAW